MSITRKFRGKRKDNSEWVHGYYEFYNGGHYINVQTDRVNSGGHPIREFIEVIPETVRQFTGLTDKNGKKIFEGDIIQSLKSSVTGLVQWFPEHSAFMVWCKSANEVGFLYECADIIKVIGNIHDNPELLKGGAE